MFVFLLLASAFFSGSEVALFSLDQSAREELAAESDRSSTLVLELLTNPRQLLITILVLNTVMNVGAAILAAVMTLKFATYLALSPTLIIVVEVVALTFVLLIISELTPKFLATQHAIRYSKIAAHPLKFFLKLLKPISSSLARMTQFIQSRLKPAAARLSSEDLKVMADVGEAQGTLEERERELIYSIVEFGSTTVREIMISRLDMVALPITATFSEAFEMIRSNGHSRIPLYKDHLDNILGIVYAKDLLPFLGGGLSPERVDWARLARPAIFVPLGKKLDDLLKDFQSRKTHIAIVVDEYGGTAGLVTLEDVLEEIVGEIRDEHDEEEARYEKLEPDLYRFDARIDLDDMDEILEMGWDTESFDFETLGGLIYHILGYIPKEGEEVTFGNLQMKVEAVEHHRIVSVIVRVVREAELDIEESEEPQERTERK